MAKQSQIEKALANLDAEIAVLQHARQKLAEQMTATARKKAPKSMRKLEPVERPA